MEPTRKEHLVIGAGQIGSQLAVLLHQAGLSVRVLRRRDEAVAGHPEIPVSAGDVRDRVWLREQLAGAVVVAGGLGWILGFVLRRYRGIFFAMLSLAFSMALYGILVKTESLGSTDGFSVSPTVLFGWSPETRHVFLAMVAAVCAFAAIVVQVYLASALGHLTTAVRDNEIRVEYLGYPVARSIHTTYVLSAMLAGAAGGIMAMALGQVDPDSMVNWTVSGELVFITIMAGAGNVAAPFIGGVVFEFIRTYAFELAPHAWQLIVGATLLAIIFFLPNGLWSLIEKPWKKLEKRRD